MSYAERAYAGPDITGRLFEAEPVAHCCAWDEYRKVKLLWERLRRAGR